MTQDRPAGAAVCLDVGSTWTKAVLVRSDGTIQGFAEHPTTTGDVLAGVDAAVGAVTAATRIEGETEVLAASSAGGGLRLAVIGTDALTTSDAGYHVAQTVGSRVVHVHAGPLAAEDVRTVRGSRPGALLLMGGADGDDPSVLLHNAGRLARARVRYPIVLAGNAEARDDAMALLRGTGRTVVACDNVAPTIGRVVAGPARQAVADVFAGHVLGDRGPAAAPRFRRLVRSTTLDAVARGAVEIARITGSRVLLVDVGCATTDVHAATPDGELHRTVEGDLGLRAAAAGVLTEGQAEGLVDPIEADLLAPAVERMAAEPGWIPRDAGGAAEDRRIAALAAAVAVRRHVASRDADGDRPGVVVLSGGVFRQREREALRSVVSTLRSDPVLAPVLADARVVVDNDVVLAAAGLLAAHDREVAAEALLQDHLLG
ncbi:MAG: glutamate mutase L [Pseudonocardia sp.]|uniref:glutamate mutase L n=1 Tax=unclassified Pseudonocardia TaxID=2619320 RepID=UPI00086C1870|nr:MULTISPECIES: glutamate mutase L [unclassified Pseudonocardia]MBN9108506.1 glutamate mutase L [Pseudonocardia sp.]ODU27992.1 MAG: hypothetical protein ABS80_02905 [Pseudonocardia sp. SCN 72-51]ODV07937.1 MAG: hypothetical protein ABT15_07170 [Pseudonocardia sp. SCN 73-27]